MIVECKSCQTRFQLDEERIPPQGIRVRCSRCKEAFFLKHPAASGSQAVDQIAREAAGGAGSPAPDATQDLTEESRVEVSRTSPAISSPGLPTGVDGSSFSGSEFEEAEESDWEFIDDLPAGGDAGEDHIEDDLMAPEISDANLPGSVFSAEDFEEPAPSEKAAAQKGAGRMESRASEVSGREGSATSRAVAKGAAHAHEPVFGSVDDFSSLADEEPEAAQVPAAPADQDEVAAVAGLSSESDLGEPEDWDFFSDESLEEPGSVGRGLAVTPAQDSASDARMVSDNLVGPGLDGYSGVLPTSRGAGPVARAARAVGWVVTLGLLAAGLARGLVPGLRPGVEVPTAVDLGGVRAEKIRGHWVETSGSGVLYTVTGRLRNTSRQAARPGARLEVSLLDAAGGRLESPASSAGIPMREAELRELPLEGLRALQEQAAWSLSATSIGPGDAVPFLALLDEVPEEAARFLLELKPAEAPLGETPLPLPGESELAPRPSSEAPSSEMQEEGGDEEG